MCLVGHYTTKSVYQKHQSKIENENTFLQKLQQTTNHFELENASQNHEAHHHHIDPTSGKRYCAVAPYPELMTRTQPDGSSLNVYLRGNEMASYLETEDGYTILKDTDDYFKYANQTSNGHLFLPRSLRTM